MKKRLSLLLVLCLILTLAVGCGSKPAGGAESEAPGGSIVESEAPGGGAEIPDEGGTEEDVYYNVAVEAFYTEEDMRMFLLTETWGEETQQSEYNNLSFIAYPGDTLESLMADMDYSGFELLDPNGTFQGWMKYEGRMDEEEMILWTRDDDTLYTAGEIMAMAVTDHSLCFVAKWSDIDDSYYAENGY